MKRFLVMLIVTLTPLAILAQEAKNILKPQYSLSNNNFSAGTGFATPFTPLNFNFATGMNFGSFGSGGFMESYLSPSLIMPLNQKLSISAGVTYSHTEFNKLPLINSNGEYEKYTGGINTLTIQTSGLYQVNDKLSFTGSAFKTINPALNTRLNPSVIQMEAQGFSVGVGYKLSENAYIGAEIRYQQGNSNFYSPFGSPYYHNFQGAGINPFNSSYRTPFGN